MSLALPSPPSWAHTHTCCAHPYTPTHCQHPYTLTHMLSTTRHIHSHTLCTSVYTHLRVVHILTPHTHTAHPYTPTLTVHILTHCAYPYTHTVHILTHTHAVHNLTHSLTHTVHIRTHSHSLCTPPVARESWGLRSSHCRAEETSLGVCPGPNIPLQGRLGSRGCIPGSPGESGLVSRGSQGLRSPLESRRGSLGAP